MLQNTSPGYNLGLDLKTTTTTTKPHVWHKVRKGTIFTKPRDFKLSQVRVRVYVDGKDLKAKDLAPSVKMKTNKKLLYQGKGSLGKTVWFRGKNERHLPASFIVSQESPLKDQFPKLDLIGLLSSHDVMVSS